MKILTTAAFSVLLLRKRISSTKWFALFALALGVGIVQIQAGAGSGGSSHSRHEMHPLTGFMAVVAACFTSGLAGVYFEMVLKGSQVDLWVRNVQLSLFSLLPALVPIIASSSNSSQTSSSPFIWSLFANFGFWAWATVLTQVFGGLLTAIVIKHADNILKGFATSLSIVLSFMASVALFGYSVTPSFVVGSGMVLAATAAYNRPETESGMGGMSVPLPKLVKGVVTPRKSSYPGSPVEPGSPILGSLDLDKKRSSLSLSGVTNGNSNGSASPKMLAAALRLVSGEEKALAGHNETVALNDDLLPSSAGLSRSGSSSSLSATAFGVKGYPVQPSYYSNPHSRSPSPMPGYAGSPLSLHGHVPVGVKNSRPPSRASQLAIPSNNIRSVEVGGEP